MTMNVCVSPACRRMSRARGAFGYCRPMFQPGIRLTFVGSPPTLSSLKRVVNLTPSCATGTNVHRSVNVTSVWAAGAELAR